MIKGPIKKLRERLLSETAAHYNIDNRAHAHGVGCQYETVYGQRCAIGRTMSDEGIADLRGQGRLWCPVGSILRMFGDKVFQEQWKPLMTEDNLSFLGQIQSLHDKAQNWTDTGLSEWGIIMVDNIRKRYIDGQEEPALL